MASVKQFKSETVLFFLATAVGSVITELVASEGFKEALGSNATMIIFGMSVAGYMLRRYTTKPLDPFITPKQPPPELDPFEEALRESDEDMHN